MVLGRHLQTERMFTGELVSKLEGMSLADRHILELMNGTSTHTQAGAKVNETRVILSLLESHRRLMTGQALGNTDHITLKESWGQDRQMC